MASRDDDKVMGGLLRRTLASSPKSEIATAGNDCPPPDVLAAYYERSLGAEESAPYELHFSQCARCREQLAAMVRAEQAPGPQVGWAWLWNPYWLAPALGVLALAVFFGAHRFTQTATTSQPASAPLLAMSRPGQPLSQEPAQKSGTPIENPRSAPLTQRQKAASDSAARDSLVETRPLSPQASPPVANKKDVPSNGRNIDALQPLVESGNRAADSLPPPKPVESQSTSPSVAVSGTAAVLSAAPAGPSAVGGAIARARPSAPEAPAETVNRNQAEAPAAMSRYSAAAKAPSPQLDARSITQKVFQTPNTNVLWRSADGGFVERSPDGGATWEGQLLPGSSGEIDAGSSPTPKICWLAGSGGTIYLTKDAVNWKKIQPPVPADFSAIQATDASNATVTTSDGRKFQTSDGGKKWKALP